MEDAEEREWDMKRSFRRILYPSIFGYLVASLILFYFLRYSTLEGTKKLVSWGLLLVIIGFIFIFTAVKTQKRQMILSRFGYNVQEKSTRPWFVFGCEEFELYRIDKGFGMGSASEPNQYKQKLAERQSRQRDLDCEVCGDTLKEGGYFVEKRTICRVLFIPYREKIEEVEGYCGDHEPDRFI